FPADPRHSEGLVGPPTQGGDSRPQCALAPGRGHLRHHEPWIRRQVQLAGQPEAAVPCGGHGSARPK
ncbi:unnamed protein product, partial [Ectocarpus sp. 12 AP-2014]